MKKLRAGSLSDDPKRHEELREAMKCSTEVQLVARLPSGGVFRVNIPKGDQENSKRIVGTLPLWLWPFSAVNFRS